jgi:hypothetical protein
VRRHCGPFALEALLFGANLSSTQDPLLRVSAISPVICWGTGITAPGGIDLHGTAGLDTWRDGLDKGQTNRDLVAHVTAIGRTKVRATPWALSPASASGKRGRDQLGAAFTFYVAPMTLISCVYCYLLTLITVLY